MTGESRDQLPEEAFSFDNVRRMAFQPALRMAENRPGCEPDRIQDGQSQRRR